MRSVLSYQSLNGLAPCGYGSLTAGCVCCPNADGKTACLSLIQKCVPGLDDGYICVNNSEYTSSCASGGLANCGTGCMPSGATCCSGQNDWFPAGYRCGTTFDCIPDTLSSSSSRSSSPAAAFTLSPSTTKATATSPTTTVPVLSSATTKITATSATTTVSALSSPTNKNAATSSISASHSQSASSVATRKSYGGISSLVIMIAVNVFIFPWP